MAEATTKKRKICVITCYNMPDYVRARGLRSAIERMDGAELIVVKNTSKGVKRYFEVAYRVLKTRLTERPDVYILTFRGYEMLPVVWLLALGKPVIFDELVNFIEWIAYEHKKVKPGSLPYAVLWAYYRMILAMPRVILADTKAHAVYSAQLMRMSAEKFVAVPVATDEELFVPQQSRVHDGLLKVYYYGTMLPLHGLGVVLDAAVRLKDQPIEFLVVGGKKASEVQANDAIQQGAKVTYRAWVPFEEFPDVIAGSDVCLGGPFGGTLQAGMVITGKTYQFMAAGRATIVGKIAHETPFVDKENCLLVEQNDVEALVEVFEWALANRDKLPAIGEAARETYLRDMSVERVKEALERDVLPRISQKI